MGRMIDHARQQSLQFDAATAPFGLGCGGRSIAHAIVYLARQSGMLLAHRVDLRGRV
jgi:hypothetical protein